MHWNDERSLEAAEDFVMIIEELRADRAQMRAEFGQFRSEMRGDFAELRREIRDVDHRTTEGSQALDVGIGDVNSDLMKWSFVFWCGAAFSVAALAGVLR